MTKKSLILYASMTGNTEKVAGVFRQVFNKQEWQCDVFKIDGDIDPRKPPFEYADYDFLCVGSPVIGSLPVREMVDIMALNPASPHHGNPGLMGSTMGEIKQRFRENRRFVSIAPAPQPLDDSPLTIRFGPESKKGIVFVTFGGVHMGPKEAVPSLALLESEMEHLRFECVGKFACPGRLGRSAGWFSDLQQRPNDNDLKRAELFLEDVLEQLPD